MNHRSDPLFRVPLARVLSLSLFFSFALLSLSVSHSLERMNLERLDGCVCKYHELRPDGS